MKKNQKIAKQKTKRSQKRPLQIGNEYNLDITSMTPNGQGIGRVQVFMVLVNGTQIGENKTIIITKIDPLNAEAELQQQIVHYPYSKRQIGSQRQSLQTHHCAT